MFPIFGIVGRTEDTAGKVLLAAVIVEFIDLRGNERIAVANKDTGAEEAQMMESAGAAEPSSENDSIHSFTLKQWFENLCHDDRWMDACKFEKNSHSQPHSWLEGKYYFSLY